MLKDFFGEVNLISQGVKELKDFTLTTYKKLLQVLLANGYSFQTLNMERAKREEETVKRKQDSQSRKEELGIKSNLGIEVFRNLGIRKKTMNEKLGLRFRTTWDIIDAAERGLLPDKIMLNIHPQRWDDNPWPWVKELVWQNVKNVIKKYFYVRK
jgi:hypothetical protein